MVVDSSNMEINSSPETPLSSLRLSKIDYTKSEGRKRRNSDRRSRRMSLKQEKEIKTPRANSSDGFNPEVSISPIASNNNNEDEDKVEMKTVNELATILLDTRKTFQADCNIIDSKDGNIHGDKENSFKTNNSSSKPSIEISRSTFIRAEKVKTMIGLQYLLILRIHEQAQSEESNNKYKGVIGVYNPLQILRNRKIRKKYKEYPAPLSLKTLPLPCNAFSLHNKDKGKPWKMYWSIELSEFLGDTSWRTGHWHELKNPKGKLWFPTSNNSSPYNKSTRQRLHDRIFTDGESDSGLKDSVHLSATSLSTEDNKSSRKSQKRKSFKKQFKKGVGRFHDRGSSSDESLSFFVPSISNNSSSNTSRGKKRSQIFEEGTSGTEVERNISHEKGSSDAIAEDINEEEPTDEMIKEVVIKPLEKSKAEELNLTTEHIEEIKQKPQIMDIGEKEFNILMPKFMIIEKIISLRLYYLLKIYPKLMEESTSKINDIMQQQIPIVFQNIILINEDYLPQYEDLYTGLSGEIKSVIRMVNTDYSIRIDKLLSNSDRCIGEINTSLSLEIRKVNEKLDNLNSLLFRNLVTTSLSIDPTMNLKHGANKNKLVYFILENFIVVMLRLIWVVVNFYKLIMTFLRVLYKIVKYILC